ncbi:hypothetical protein B0H10DRAFT_2229276 [Mycena sp. CBHHK59/15]|nr:hypothetical protein B0H10DRAFT_2229276 [Mycena sp. CBHHK59/15]
MDVQNNINSGKELRDLLYRSIKTMKSVLALLASCVVFAAAQNAQIDSPTDGTVVGLGETLTVQLERPRFIGETSVEVGIAIAIQSCPISPCSPPSKALGTVLFTGPFTPAIHGIPSRPYQNFSVPIPDNFGTGRAQLSVSRFHLLGKAPVPTLQFLTVELEVAVVDLPI